MDGLEAVEISFSKVVGDNEAFRVDSDFFKKKYIAGEQLLKKASFVLLKDVIESLKSFGAYSLCNDFEYIEAGIPFVRCMNIKNGKVDFSNMLHINEQANALLWKSEVKPRMVLLAMSGSIGGCALAQEDWGYPINSNQDIAKITTLESFCPYFLTVFLNGQYGQDQLARMQVGSVQQHVFLWQLENIVIPDFGKVFQGAIKKLLQQSYTNDLLSSTLQIDADQTLRRTLDLENWQPTNQHDSIKNFSQSFAVAGRLDAEYYQPKYDAWAKRIKQCPAGFDELGTTCQIKEANFSPDDAQTYHYIELSDIGSHGNITGATEDIGAALPTRARRRVATGDVVVSSIEGSLQSVALVTDDYDNALCSTGFYVVRSDTINAETLLVLFKSEAYQNLFKQACTGTILTAMPKEFFGRIPMPVIDVHVQQTIAEKVQASFSARRQSQQLLELAKQTVERAIESSEAEALEWLEVQLRQVA